MKVTVTEFRKIFRTELTRMLNEYQGPRSLMGPGFEAWDHRDDPDHKIEDKSLETVRDTAIKQIVKEEVNRYFEAKMKTKTKKPSVKLKKQNEKKA